MIRLISTNIATLHHLRQDGQVRDILLRDIVSPWYRVRWGDDR